MGERVSIYLSGRRDIDISTILADVPEGDRSWFVKELLRDGVRYRQERGELQFTNTTRSTTLDIPVTTEKEKPKTTKKSTKKEKPTEKPVDDELPTGEVSETKTAKQEPKIPADKSDTVPPIPPTEDETDSEDEKAPLIALIEDDEEDEIDFEALKANAYQNISADLDSKLDSL